MDWLTWKAPSFPKPLTWKYMPMFEKIGYYKTRITADYAPFVDKLKAKQIALALCPDGLRVARVVRELSGIADFSAADLNPAWILKASHGCGWNLDLSGATAEAALAALASWNTTYRSTEEPHYRFLHPRFFIEEKIVDTSQSLRHGVTGAAGVYMIRCVHNKAISVSYKWGGRQNTYDLSWNLLKRPDFPNPLPRPPQLSEMIRFAERLSRPFEFVRVDFYLGTDSQRETEGIYFSEFTFTPTGGYMFYPFKVEHTMGRLWT
jgi:hypothetical protein